MSEAKKYYWLKLKRDFFKRHDITVIESMPNGDKYILFYMKMLVESIDHDGALRFSDTVPYNDSMLAAITRTDIDIVRSAVKIFEQFGMMEMLDDGTQFMRQIESMIGDETEWAAKKREYREKQKLIETDGGQKRTLSDKSIEYRDKSIDKDIKKEDTPDKPAKRASFQKPSLDEVKAYCQERKNKVDPAKFLAYYDSNGWKVGRNAMKDWRAAVRTWEDNGYDSKPSYSKPLPIHSQTKMLDLED